jgi:hypothetical protein
LKRTSTATGFYFFIFKFEYLLRVQSSEPLHAKWIQPPACLDHGLHVLKLRSFPNRAPKMQARHQLFFGLRLVSKEFQHLAIQTKIEQHFGRFFHKIKVFQPIGRHVYANRDRNKQEVGFVLHAAAQNFEVF